MIKGVSSLPTYRQVLQYGASRYGTSSAWRVTGGRLHSWVSARQVSAVEGGDANIHPLGGPVRAHHGIRGPLAHQQSHALRVDLCSRPW